MSPEVCLLDLIGSTISINRTRIENVPITNDSGSISFAEDRNGPVSPLQQNVEVVAALVTNTAPLPHAKDMVLKPEDTSAPNG